MAFAIRAKRISSMRRALGAIPDDAWRDAIDMDNAQVAVSPYRPADWPGNTVLLRPTERKTALLRGHLEPTHWAIRLVMHPYGLPELGQ